MTTHYEVVISFLAESDRSRHIPSRQLYYAITQRVSRMSTAVTDGKKEELTDSMSWRVKTLADMVDGGTG